MNRQAILKGLRAARSSQLQWITFTRSLGDNPSSLEKFSKSALQAQKRFEEWYYGAAKPLARLTAFELVTVNHKALTELQDQILESLTQPAPAESDRFLSWFRDPRRHNPALQQLIGKAQRRSQRLLDGLEILEKEVQALPDETLEKLASGEFVHNNVRFLIN